MSSRFKRVALLSQLAILACAVVPLSSQAQAPYFLGVSPLEPAWVNAGQEAVSTITLSSLPLVSYTGTVTLSCSNVSGGVEEANQYPRVNSIRAQ